MQRLLLALVLTLLPAMAGAQNRSEDEYTRYELLAPDTSSFKIIYDVTAVTPGAKFYFNPIRKGSVASDESVIDLASGEPLKFEQVSGAAAREAGLTAADLEGEYIKVTLARPVPAGGEARIRIIKTYKDPKSYFRQGDGIVFDRPLGIKRNAVVLPPGYELVALQHPLADPRRSGRPRGHQLHEHVPRPGAARAPRRGRSVPWPHRRHRPRPAASAAASPSPAAAAARRAATRP